MSEWLIDYCRAGRSTGVVVVIAGKYMGRFGYVYRGYTADEIYELIELLYPYPVTQSPP